MLSWRGQDATRQAHRRDVNESVGDAAGGMSPERCLNSFICECGDPRCARTVCLSLAEYESVRAYPTHFVIATNHENPDVEYVLEESARFAIVATLCGEASKIALRTDPRVLCSATLRPSGVSS